jgi:hypothetical protein
MIQATAHVDKLKSGYVFMGGKAFFRNAERLWYLRGPLIGKDVFTIDPC